MNDIAVRLNLLGEDTQEPPTQKRPARRASAMREEIELRILSLGAGVQSTTMLLMALKGEFEERPDAAIFADTGWEPKAVYDHLAWIEKTVAPFPIYRVAHGNIRDSFYHAKSTNKRYVSIPAFVKNPDGSGGIGRRQCTREFKIEPIQKEVRRLMAERGVKRRRGVISVEQWIGISLEEISRMKDSRVAYIRHRWPLVDCRMTRHDCANWLARNSYPLPPKSACVGCPYHSNHEWRNIRDTDPKAWQEAVAFDREIRKGGPRGLLVGENYLHRSLIPLDQVDLQTAEERGHLSLWTEECEGMCGL